MAGDDVDLYCIVHKAEVGPDRRIACCNSDPEGDQHPICDDCFLQHVEHLDPRRLVRGRVPCPAVTDAAEWQGCTYADAAVAAVYARSGSSPLLERYLSKALGCPPASFSVGGPPLSVLQLADGLLQAANITCPACHVAQDPLPDGCRAVQCGCGCNYCWVCFAVSPTRMHNHMHVINQHGGLFLDQAHIDAAHRVWRRTTLAAYVRSRIPERQRAEVVAYARRALVALDPELPQFALAAQALGEGQGGLGPNPPLVDETRPGQAAEVPPDSPRRRRVDCWQLLLVSLGAVVGCAPLHRLVLPKGLAHTGTRGQGGPSRQRGTVRHAARGAYAMSANLDFRKVVHRQLQLWEVGAPDARRMRSLWRGVLNGVVNAVASSAGASVGFSLARVWGAFWGTLVGGYLACLCHLRE
eukprot:jgi/Mesvir1/19893/Mv25389-RA.1